MKIVCSKKEEIMEGENNCGEALENDIFYKMLLPNW